MEFVLCSLSCFYIEIAYSNFTLCGPWTPSFFAFTWKITKFQENEHTPGVNLTKGIHGGFETRCRQRQKSKTGVSVAVQKGHMSSKFFLKSLPG